MSKFLLCDGCGTYQDAARELCAVCGQPLNAAAPAVTEPDAADEMSTTPVGPGQEPAGVGRRRLWLSAIPVGTVVVGLLVALVAFIGPGREERSGETTENTTSTTTATTQPNFPPFPTTPGPVNRGTYRTDLFSPPVAFTVGDGWKVMSTPLRGTIDLVSADPAKTVTLMQPQYIYDPNRSYDDSASVDDQATRLPVPRDVLGWLCSHRRLNPCQQVTERLGSVQVPRATVSVKDPSHYPFCLNKGRSCVLLFDIEKRIEFALDGNAYAFYLKSVGNATVLVMVEAPAAELDAFLSSSARAIVESLRPA